MANSRGAVLITSLIYLLVMSLLLSAMLIVTQLSHKAALAGQQQLQLSQQALQQHLSAVNSNVAAPEPEQMLAQCPAAYAAWSEGSVQCQVIRLQTEQYAANRQAYAAYSSLLLRQTLVEQ